MLEPDPEIVAVIGEWVQKAENDLTNAAHTLKLGRKCPTDTVCFHAQQCVEKYVKSLLVFGGIHFPRTHEIGILVHLLPVRVRPGLTREEADQLTNYAVMARYPIDSQPISLIEARRAVSIARRVRSHIRKLLPKGSL
ncbi:HEPN domain-containing protein [Candidatus Sumerlaeota bacterium]|nr:HEPN domain-containing protein [Candidatus Sumerlaeota bacterium]